MRTNVNVSGSMRSITLAWINHYGEYIGIFSHRALPPHFISDLQNHFYSAFVSQTINEW